MRKHFIINYTIYPFDLLVSVCEPDSTVKKVLEEKLQEDFHLEIDAVFVNSDARTTMFSGGQTIIRFSKKPTMGLIAHEALHAVEFLMERIGNEQVNEPWNYLLQYIVNEISRNLKL